MTYIRWSYVTSYLRNCIDLRGYSVLNEIKKMVTFNVVSKKVGEKHVFDIVRVSQITRRVSRIQSD